MGPIRKRAEKHQKGPRMAKKAKKGENGGKEEAICRSG